jgi:hypothetical protein
MRPSERNEQTKQAPDPNAVSEEKHALIGQWSQTWEQYETKIFSQYGVKFPPGFDRSVNPFTCPHVAFFLTRLNDQKFMEQQTRKKEAVSKLKQATSQWHEDK